MGQYKIALGYLRKSIAIAEELDAKPLIMNAQESFGQVYLEMGDLKHAIRHFTQLQELAEELQLDMSRCSALSGLGSAHLRMGQHSDALRCHQEELNIACILEHELSVARAYSGLGCSHMKLEEYSQAIECHEKDKAISERLECRPGLKRAHGNLGDVCKRTGDYAKAIEHHQEYLKMAKHLEDKPAQTRAHASLGLEHFHSRNLAQAFRHFTIFGDLLSDLEEQLSEGQWRQHLTGFVENYAECMDAWVAAAAQAGDMLEALRVEEWRRCRSELPYLPKVGDGNSSGDIQGIEAGDKDVMAHGLEDIAKRVDASFIIMFKMYENTLMTWVLSGETGKLVYQNLVDLRGRQRKVSEWVASVTFAEWAEWQQAFEKARRWLERVKQAEGSLRNEDLQNIAKALIKDSMRGDLDENLWASIHDPRTFPETVFGLSRPFKTLQSHFFQKAENSRGELSKLLWKPILEECTDLQKSLQDDAPCTKLVRASFSLAHFARILLFFFIFLISREEKRRRRRRRRKRRRRENSRLSLTRPCCALHHRCTLLQIYFLPDPPLSSIPFCALKSGERFLIEKVLVAQASSLRTLACAEMRWHAICTGPHSPSEVRLECSFHITIFSTVS